MDSGQVFIVSPLSSEIEHCVSSQLWPDLCFDLLIEYWVHDPYNHLNTWNYQSFSDNSDALYQVTRLQPGSMSSWYPIFLDMLQWGQVLSSYISSMWRSV